MEVLKKKMLELLRCGLAYEKEYPGKEVTCTVVLSIKAGDTLQAFPIHLQKYVDEGRRAHGRFMLREFSKRVPPDYACQTQRGYMASLSREQYEDRPDRVEDIPGRLEILSVAGKDREGNVAMLFVEVLPDGGGYGEVTWIDSEPEHTSMVFLDSLEMRE